MHLGSYYILKFEWKNIKTNAKRHSYNNSNKLNENAF